MSAIAALQALLAGTCDRAQAAGFFECPRSGTVVTYTTAREQYLGPTPGDPFLCNKVDISGRDASLLFNFVAVDSKDYPKVRDVMVRLFSHAATSATYTRPVGSLVVRDTWTYDGEEAHVVDGKRFQTSVYIFDSEAAASAGSYATPWHEAWKLWLDPKRGLWVARELLLSTESSGSGLTRAPWLWNATLIQEP